MEVHDALEQRARFNWISAVAVLLLLVWGGTISGCATLDRDDLRSDMEQIRSVAAEGALLAGQARSGRVPTRFTWLHAQELRHHVLQVRDKIEGEIVEGPLQSNFENARVIIDKVAGALHLLHRLPDSHQAQYGAKVKLIHQATAADELVQELG